MIDCSTRPERCLLRTSSGVRTSRTGNTRKGNIGIPLYSVRPHGVVSPDRLQQVAVRLALVEQFVEGQYVLGSLQWPIYS